MNPAKFDGVEDCAELGYLSDASVLWNLKLRYDAQIIYVRFTIFPGLSSPIVVTSPGNPFCPLSPLPFHATFYLIFLF